MFFETFVKTGSTGATVKYFRRQGLSMPQRRDPNGVQLVWLSLRHSRTLSILHNRRCAGTLFRGRTRTHKGPQGRLRLRKLPQERWDVLPTTSHTGNITGEQFRLYEQRLRDNSQGHGRDRRNSPSGEGPALLQGIAQCGVCGGTMIVLS